jgi:hypothetical protein
MANKIQLRRDTALNWTNTNPILSQGEPGYETDTGKIKYGDGVTEWNDLDYSGFSGDYDDLTGTPVIPADIAELTDDQSLLPDQELNTTSSVTFQNLDVASTISVYTLLVNDQIVVGELQGFDDVSIVKDSEDILNLRLRNLHVDSGSQLNLIDNISGGLTLYHHNSTQSAGQYEAGHDYIFGESINDSLHIGRNHDIGFWADENWTGYDISTSSIFISKQGGRVTFNTPISFSSSATITGDLVPADDEQHSLGTPEKKWKDIFVSTGSIYIGNIKLTNDNGQLNVQQVLNPGSESETPVPDAPGVVTTDRLVNGENSFVLTDNGTVELNGEPFSGGSTGSSVLPYIELTNNPFIVQSAVLGEPVEFTRTAEGSETDIIDTGLTLARGSQGALYNIDSELEYDNNNHTSPAGTEWNSDGWGNLLNLTSRSYGTLRSVLNNAIGNNIVGAELVMHDTINDRYYKFEFSDWGQNNGGSFAYTRTLVTDPNYFRKEDYGNEVDVIVEDDGQGAGIGITRGTDQGIYNPYREGSWDSDISPGGTLWNIDGWDDLSDITERNYQSFYDAYDGNLGNRVPGSRAVMYIPETEKYYAIQWLSWTQGGNGGRFSYTRREIDLTKLNEGVKFPDGTVLKSAQGIGRVKLESPGNRRIEEVQGYKSVNVTEVVTNNLTTVASRADTSSNVIWIDSTTTTIDDIINNPSNYGNAYAFEFSLDNSTWWQWGGGTSFNGDERGYGVYSASLTYLQGDTVYFRYKSGGAPVVWWDKADLPGGSANFRGAVIDYHAYTGEATIIGTIHIVDDDGEENITHTEVSSGSTDSENDDLWLVQNEGTISYRRIDGEDKTLKVQWTARIFYGSELYD